MLFFSPSSLSTVKAKPCPAFSSVLMPSCWKPEDLLKKRIFFLGVAAGSAARSMGSASVKPANANTKRVRDFIGMRKSQAKRGVTGVERPSHHRGNSREREPEIAGRLAFGNNFKLE